jgi:hypothetical protein
MSRNVAITVTVITVLCCACPGFVLCVLGGAIAAGAPLNTEFNGVSNVQNLPPTYGIGLICLSVILILIPIAVGFFTLRKKPAAVESPVVPPSEQVPPAS